jgi:ubiquinone/menaquinone biosynthesis C-methylase UbiE
MGEIEMPTQYAIAGGEPGKRRLDLLAGIMAPTTQALLADAGVCEGLTCVDVGCGAGHVSRSLAVLVGQAGRVVGLDVDPVKLAAASEETARAGLPNVEFRAVNVSEWSDPGTYDLAYGRFILSHLPDRIAVLGRMAQALRAAGVLILEDIDFAGAFCFPENASYARYCELYRAVVQRRGGDADVGPQLYGMCAAAGLSDVHVRVVQPVHYGDDIGKTLSLSTLVNISDSIIAESLATVSELQEVIAALTAHSEDPQSVISVPRIFQVWGRQANGGH